MSNYLTVIPPDNRYISSKYTMEATRIPAGSTWLYSLDMTIGNNKKNTSFSGYKAVFALFFKTFSTGYITLPISLVEAVIHYFQLMIMIQ